VHLLDEGELREGPLKMERGDYVVSFVAWSSGLWVAKSIRQLVPTSGAGQRKNRRAGEGDRRDWNGGKQRMTTDPFCSTSQIGGEKN
jgi:hypothetical protein